MATSSLKKGTAGNGRRDVDAYMTTLRPEARQAVQRLRSTVLAAAPGAVEGFSYGVPAIRVDGRPVVCFAAAKSHYSLFPMSGKVMKIFAVELKGFDTSKGTIRFAMDEPLPTRLVQRIVKAKLAELRSQGRQVRPRSHASRRTAGHAGSARSH